MKTRGELNTEQQNPKSVQIDSMSISDILKTINRDDQTIAKAVEAAIPDIEKTVEFTVPRPIQHRKDYLLVSLLEEKKHCEIPLKVLKIGRKKPFRI